MKFKEFLEARDHEAVIRALRSKTERNGATSHEARAAAAKADELESKHKPQPKPQRPIPARLRTAHRAHWSKAQWDAHLDAMERDLKR